MEIKYLQAVALAASAAFAIKAVCGDVAGFRSFDCSDEESIKFDSVADACAASGINSYLDLEDILRECTLCEDDYGGGGIVPPRIIIIPPGMPAPVCPAGTHGHGDQCHADHVCGENEIGGGSKDCETCPDGTVPNEDKTECVSRFSYQVARCERSLEPTSYGKYLPAQHPNVLTEKLEANVLVESTQRGFFPAAGYEEQAGVNAALYLAAWLPGGPRPVPIYVPSDVYEDAIQGTCRYEGTPSIVPETKGSVSKERYDAVNDRMLRTVNVNPPWDGYHAIVNNSIEWGNEVLK